MTWIRLPFKRLLACLTLAGFIAGCATRHHVDWNSRVGQYTYDDAVREFGPPDAKEVLGDGSISARWVLEGRNLRSSPSVGGYGGYYGFPGRRWRMGFDTDVFTTPEYGLRLHFGPDQKLVTAKRYAR